MEKELEKKLLVIIGPTASGKSALALSLAKQFDGELISADSRQIYKDFDIGTGKEVTELRSGTAVKADRKWLIEDIPVHLYDLVSGKDQFSAGDYASLARQKIEEVWTRNKLPILVGGTGLYIKATIDGIDTIGIVKNEQLRESLASKTVRELQELLEKANKTHFEQLNNSDRNNPRRLTRYIEIATQKSALHSELHNRLPATVLKIGLQLHDTDTLSILEHRIATMFALGLEQEAIRLLAQGYTFKDPAFQAIGYAEFEQYIAKQATRTDVQSAIVSHTRQYVKRQLTWFNADKTITWFTAHNPVSLQNAVAYVEKWYNRNN